MADSSTGMGVGPAAGSPRAPAAMSAPEGSHASTGRMPGESGSEPGERVSRVRGPVSGARGPVSRVRCPGSGVPCLVSGVWCLVSENRQFRPERAEIADSDPKCRFWDARRGGRSAWRVDEASQIRHMSGGGRVSGGRARYAGIGTGDGRVHIGGRAGACAQARPARVRGRTCAGTASEGARVHVGGRTSAGARARARRPLSRVLGLSERAGAGTAPAARGSRSRR